MKIYLPLFSQHQLRQHDNNFENLYFRNNNSNHGHDNNDDEDYDDDDNANQCCKKK